MAGIPMQPGMMAGGGMGAASPIPGQTPTGAMPEAEAEESMINLDKVRGRVKSSSVRQITEIVDTQPDETLSVLRQWMNKEQ
jgi:flagellar M-ring protein FliF